MPSKIVLSDATTNPSDVAELMAQLQRNGLEFLAERSRSGWSLEIFEAAVPPEPVPEPESRLLSRFYIAGFQYYRGPVTLSRLEEGDVLEMVREPYNEHDERAVALYYQGNKLGYVTKDKNSEVASLLDTGSTLRCVVVGADPAAPSYKAVECDIFLRGGAQCL